MPFDQLSDFITPSELFYIRSHFPTPELDPVAFRLRIRGAVRKELSLSYDALRAMPSRKCVATLECAGNSRVFLTPPVPGARWNSARSAMRNGPAFPFLCFWKAPDWPIRCATSFWKAPMAACRRKSLSHRVVSPMPAVSRGRGRWNRCFIAYQMNGQDLTPDHGYPQRAIVPGYYGMSSVKWLTDIVAATQPFQGNWQTSDYGYWDDSEGIPVRRPLAEMKLKSQIARPHVYERFHPGRPTLFLASLGSETPMSLKYGSASMTARRGFRAISSIR